MRFSLLFAVLMLFGCQTSTKVASDAKDFHGDHHAGDRQGFHGMALFGKAPTFYLAHIPTFSRPHNEQLILKVRAFQVVENAGGQEEFLPIDTDFHNSGHSIAPLGLFSLDDLANGDLKTFRARIHSGNFEQGGAVIIAIAEFRVEKVMTARNLPGEADAPDGEQTYYVFGTTDLAFLVNQIRGNRDRQQILRGQIAGEFPGLSDSRVTKLRFSQDNFLAASTSELTGELRRAGAAEPTEVKLVADTELWCLIGPGFFQACPN